MTDETVFEMQQIGARIREERQIQKMSQATLAELSNVSLPMISNIENGKSVMLLDTFLKIIDALHVSADTILRPDTPNVSLISATMLTFSRTALHKNVMPLSTWQSN